MKDNKNKTGLFRKKKFMLFVMAILLCGAGYANYTHKDETAKVLGQAQYVSTTTPVEMSKSDEIKLSREEARDKAKGLLEEIVNNEAHTAEAKQDAEKKLVLMSDYIRIEADIEVMLKNKGFENAVVTYNENGVVIDVLKDELLNTEIAKITEIAVSQTHLEADKIKITTNN